jgi:hypothetical protein
MKQIVERRGDHGVDPRLDHKVELRCHACDRLLARAVAPTIDVSVEIDSDGYPIDPTAYYPTWGPIEPPPVAGSMTDTIPVGLVVKLEPGFVNEKRRYDGDLPWYVKRRGSAHAFEGRVRLPAVLTCDCGEDNLVPRRGMTDATGVNWSNLSDEEREDELRTDVRHGGPLTGD